jgi:hypothetical protein
MKIGNDGLAIVKVGLQTFRLGRDFVALAAFPLAMLQLAR